MGYSPLDGKESDTTQQLTHVSGMVLGTKFTNRNETLEGQSFLGTDISMHNFKAVGKAQ